MGFTVNRTIKRGAVAAFAMIGIFSCSGESVTGTDSLSTDDLGADAVRIASVTVSLGAASIAVGDTTRAQATVRNWQGRLLLSNVTWSSSDSTIATVSSTGLVKGIAAGSAVITAQRSGKSGSATITVTPIGASSVPTVASVTVSLAAGTLNPGQTTQGTATTRDSASNVITGRAVSWESSDTGVATVSALGVVTAVAVGTAQIIATSEGTSGSAPLSVVTPPAVVTAPGTVNDLAVTAIDSNAVTLSFTQVNDGTGAPAKYDIRLAAPPISWGSAPSVTSGSCTTAVTGTAIGSKLTCTVQGLKPSTAYNFQLNAFRGTLNQDAVFSDLSNVVAATTTAGSQPPPPVPVATVEVSPASVALNVGATAQVIAITRDASGNVMTGRAVAWSSANSAIASVSGTGVVTGRAAGTTQVIATSEGKTGSATITVSAPAPVPVATVSVSPATATLNVGATQQLVATTRDANNNVITGRAVAWSSGNSSIASVSTSGLVTAVAAGTVQITATSETKTGTATITVQAPPPPPPPGSSNEPSGMTLINERAFNTLQESPWDTDNTLSIVQDATAPKSPSSVLRATFPAGFAGGSASGHTGMTWSGGQRILYARYWMKYSTNWWGHNTGINKQSYAWVTAGYTPFVMETEGTGSGPLKPRPILQRMIRGDGNYEPNLVPNATIQRGVWFQIEIILTGNTSGTANGAMDIYLDGVHVTSVSGLQWTTGATAWNVFELYPVWGGIGDTVPATMWCQWDHVYLSKKD